MWMAHYTDGTSLLRYNEDESENGYADIDRLKLESFEASNESGVVVRVCFERPTQKLIYRRRTFVDMVGQPMGVVVLAGWQETIAGTSYKSITYLYPDGHVELDGTRNDIELLPIEG